MDGMQHKMYLMENMTNFIILISKKKRGSQGDNINTERNNETLQGSPENNNSKKAEASLKIP